MMSTNNHNTSAGYTQWIIPGGYIPLASQEPEPAHTSRDELIILNTHAEDVQVELRFYYADRNPVGPYVISVAAQRVRSIRCNDLIDPEAVPLETLYALVVSADRPIFIQFRQVYFGKQPRDSQVLMGYPIS